MCGPIMCHSNQGTPVLQSVSETERMADAVLKCIQVAQLPCMFFTIAFLGMLVPCVRYLHPFAPDFSCLT